MGGMGSLDGQGGSADTRGTASWDGLTEPLQDSEQALLTVMVVGTEILVAATGALVIVGGLCRFGAGRCLALGDLLSLRAVTGDTEAWCLRLPGRMVACWGCGVLESVSMCLWWDPLSRRVQEAAVVAAGLVPAMVLVVASPPPAGVWRSCASGPAITFFASSTGCHFFMCS